MTTRLKQAHKLHRQRFEALEVGPKQDPECELEGKLLPLSPYLCFCFCFVVARIFFFNYRVEGDGLATVTLCFGLATAKKAIAALPLPSLLQQTFFFLVATFFFFFGPFGLVH
jgi:hypothetical protein